MIASAPNSVIRRLRVPGYLLFGIAMILPLIDLAVSVYPFRFDQVIWRFGLMGLLSSAVGAPLLVLFLMFALALFSGDRKAIIVVGVVSALIALLLIGGAGSFALDALQMKRRVAAQALPKYLLASMQAMLKYGLESISAIVLAVSAFRSLSASRMAAPRSEQRASGLIVGRPSAPAPRAAAAELPPATAPETVVEEP